MRTTARPSGAGLSCTAAIVAAAGLTVPALARTPYQWTGGAATDNWNDSNNWLNLNTMTVNGFPTVADTALFDIVASVFGGAAGGITIDAAVLVTFGAGSSASTTVSGTVTNDGIATFVADGSSNIAGIDQRWFVPAASAATITGGGSLTLNGSETGIEGAGASSSFTNAAGHTLTGFGAIANITMFNSGTIAPAGLLTLRSMTLDNTGGLIDISAAGVLHVDGDATLNGGTIHGVDGARIDSVGGDGGTLSDLTLTGVLAIGGGTLSETTISGTITNNAQATFVADGTSNIGGIDQQWFVPAGASATLAGSGSLVLNGSETGLEGAGLTSVVNNASGHTISGFGAISNLTMFNTGTIAPSGQITIVNAALDNSGGQIEIGASGVLHVDGNATLSGGVVNGVNGARIDSVGINGGTLSDLTLTGVLAIGGGTSSANNISGTITNDSVSTFVADSTSNTIGIDQRLFVAGGTSATLAGSGSLTLNGSETGFQGQDSSSTFTNAAGHTITGAGQFFNLTMFNSGTIAPTGLVALANVTLDNTGGLIDIGGAGNLSIEGSASLSGGTINGASGARIDSIGVGGGTLSDFTLTGTVTIGGGTASSNTVSGTITNNGELTFHADGTNNAPGVVDQRWFIEDGSSAALAGIGSLNLNGIETGIEGGGSGASLTNGVGHTISGAGVLSNLNLANDGVIRAIGRLSLSSVTLDNTGAQLDLNPGAILSLDDETLVTGGIINGSGGTLDGDGAGGALTDVTFTGSLTLGEGGLSSQRISGTITNQSVASFVPDVSNNAANTIDQRLFVAAGSSATLTGTGQLVLNGSETGLEGDGATSSLTHAPGHTIRGQGSIIDLALQNQGVIRAEGGTLSIFGAELLDNSGGTLWAADGAVVRLSGTSFTHAATGTLRGTGEFQLGNITGQTLVNNGFIAPGSGVPSGTGTLAFTGSVSMGASSNLLIDLGGTTAGSYDRIAVSNLLALGGNSAIALVDGFVPQWNQSFTIATASSMSGSFASLALPSLTNPDWVWWNGIVGNTFQIGVRHIADLNHNGLVGFDDLNFVIANWETTSSVGDVNNSGFVDFADLNLVINFFGLTAPATVPAPGVAALAFASLAAVRRRRAAA